jgi:large subunit ribosomal protein L30
MAGKKNQIKITLVRSPIKQKPAIRKTVAALGLRHVHATQIKERRPEIEGMIRTVAHLVKVEELST